MAFLETNWKTALYWVNRCVDLCFVVDLIMNFNLIYLDDASNVYITDRMKIVKRYLRGG